MIALILGGAACLWNDLTTLQGMAGAEYGWPLGPVIAINDAGIAWEAPLDHWVTLHPDKMPGWRREREERGLPPAGTHWAHSRDAHRGACVDRAYSGNVRMHGGSSGLLAVGVAVDELGLCCVLCGVPMDGGTNGFTGKAWAPYARYRGAWERSQERLRPWVRSMSGWTRALFGPPDEAYLAAGVGAQTTTREG